MRSLKYLSVAALLSLLVLSCTDEESKSRFGNKVFINSQNNATTMLIVLGTPEYDQTLSISSAKPLEAEAQFTFSVNSSLLNTFRKAYYYPDAVMLPAENYELDNTRVVIQAGGVNSTQCGIHFTGIDQLDRNTIYVLPVSVSSNADVDFIESKTCHYYVFRKGALINTAADITENYFPVRWSSNVSGMSALTLEALLYLDNLTAGLLESDIRTVMGVEGTFLIRLGDSFEIGEVMVVKGGSKYPSGSSDRTTLPVKQWCHLAVTLEGATLKIYLDGILKSTSNVSSGSVSLTSNFYIGYSYNAARYWPGMISEARVWNVVRTQDEIEEGMYGVSTDSPGLVAYWKFNEGEGNSVADHTGNGNNITANSNLKWVSVSIPED